MRYITSIAHIRVGRSPLMNHINIDVESSKVSVAIIACFLALGGQSLLVTPPAYLLFGAKSLLVTPPAYSLLHVTYGC